ESVLMREPGRGLDQLGAFVRRGHELVDQLNTTDRRPCQATCRFRPAGARPRNSQSSSCARQMDLNRGWTERRTRPRMFDVQGIEIVAPRAKVFEFLREPGNLPRWAHAFVSADEGHARLETP